MNDDHSVDWANLQLTFAPRATLAEMMVAVPEPTCIALGVGSLLSLLTSRRGSA